MMGQNYTRAEAERNLDINANTLARWTKEQQADDSKAFRGNRKITQEQEEIGKLKTPVEHPEIEKRILKETMVLKL